MSDDARVRENEPPIKHHDLRVRVVSNRKTLLEDYSRYYGITPAEAVRRFIDDRLDLWLATKKPTESRQGADLVDLSRQTGDSSPSLFSPPLPHTPIPPLFISPPPETKDSPHPPRKRAKAQPCDPATVAVPAALDVPAFHLAWAGWFEYRKERRLPPWVQRTIVAKLEEFEAMGPDRAVRAIRHSISNGAQGIFEPKGAAPVGPAARITPEISEVWERHLVARRRYYAQHKRPCVDPDLTPAVAAVIQQAITNHGVAKAMAAGVGLFYSPFHIGKNDQQQEYLEPSRPWANKGPQSNVETFAQLYQDMEALYVAAEPAR